METGDAAMTDVFSENQPTMTSGIDSLKQCLEQHLAEINLSISRGMSEIKTDLEARMQTCHKSQMPRQDMRTNTVSIYSEETSNNEERAKKCSLGVWVW